jgi:ligand-binding sensor domain-containing protein
MSSQFSSLTWRLEHNVLRNCYRSAAGRVSLGGADGATSYNHLVASRALPRKATTRRRGRPPLIAEEAVVGS